MILPDDTDEVDTALLASLVPDDAMVNGYIVVIGFSDENGENRWRCYANSDLPVTSNLGLLELAKLDIIARSDTGLPIRAEDDGDA